MEETQSNDLDEQIDRLKERIAKLSNAELVDFENAMRTWLEKCDRGPLIDAATIMTGYVSDDAFMYWRAALLMHGKKAAENAIQDPETLADHAYFTGCEDLLYLVQKEYEKRHDRLLPGATIYEDEIDDDCGEQFENIEDALKAYPRLQEKFWEKWPGA
ncbi:MAG TPA: DUF4240 domain-containing protein [Candidatus Melainabacteria bacterium]|nr:DUF4240 domain-containing protein [Candidatus Melainabacteria bacterium]